MRQLFSLDGNLCNKIRDLFKKETFAKDIGRFTRWSALIKMTND